MDSLFGSCFAQIPIGLKVLEIVEKYIGTLGRYGQLVPDLDPLSQSLDSTQRVPDITDPSVHSPSSNLSERKCNRNFSHIMKNFLKVLGARAETIL